MTDGALAKGSDKRTKQSVDLNQRACSPTPTIFSIMTADELLCKELMPPEWVRQDMLPAVVLTLLAGAPKKGKSWFALD